jgi:hypothetical protein
VAEWRSETERQTFMILRSINTILTADFMDLHTMVEWKE